MKNWNNLSYQTITGAEIINKSLRVEFANGDIVEIELSQLFNLDNDYLKNTDKDLELQFNSNEILIGSPDSKVEVPWDKIRVLTDTDFSKAMALKAEEQALKIGLKIKRLRERQGIKSNDLADRSGISPQTISRIEKGHQDVSFTTLRKLLAAMGYTLQDLAQEDALLAKTEEPKSLSLLLKRVSRAGIDPKFLTQKIFPSILQAPFFNIQNSSQELLVDEATSYVSKVYGWTLNEIWGKENLELKGKFTSIPLFKHGGRANYNLIRAYLPYAKFLADTTIKASNSKTYNSIPESVEEFQKQLEKFGGLTLKSLLEYAWSMGICVLPLTDAGTFHGVAWRINDKHVIILKQKGQSHAKWIFDLLHEMLHVINHLNQDDEMIIELGEINPYSPGDDEKEIEANSFANEIILNGQAEKYVQEVVKVAGGIVENLQLVVKEVASKHKVRIDSLANYLAYRLAAQGRNWWGPAETLQEKEPSAFDVAKEVFLDNVSMEKLNPIEYNLLTTALNINFLNYENKN